MAKREPHRISRAARRMETPPTAGTRLPRRLVVADGKARWVHGESAGNASNGAPVTTRPAREPG
jgi:hypothetical protein